jgi:hypothetical protein
VTNAIEDLDEWLARGKELRTALMQERAKLIARVAEIDAAVAKLPRVENGGHADGQPVSLENMTLSEAIKAVLRTAPGLSAHDLRDRMGGGKVNIRSLYSTLNRLAKAGDVRVEGSRGQQVYRWEEEI